MRLRLRMEINSEYDHIVARGKDLVGREFGDLKVYAYSHKDKHGHLVWICRCNCGVIIHVRGGNLLRGVSARCTWCRLKRSGLRLGKYQKGRKGHAKAIISESHNPKHICGE